MGSPGSAPPASLSTLRRISLFPGTLSFSRSSRLEKWSVPSEALLPRSDKSSIHWGAPSVKAASARARDRTAGEQHQEAKRPCKAIGRVLEPDPYQPCPPLNRTPSPPNSSLAQLSGLSSMAPCSSVTWSKSTTLFRPPSPPQSPPAVPAQPAGPPASHQGWRPATVGWPSLPCSRREARRCRGWPCRA